MESVLLGLQSRLDEMSTTLMELKAENRVLRNEILGIGPSAESNVKRMGILENKTLREFVEEIQFDIKSIKTEMQNGTRRRDSSVKKKSELSELLKISADDNEEEVDDDVPIDEYTVTEIEHKTIEEHRAWMKLKFTEERAKLRDPVDGETLSGKTLESISSSIPISSEAVSSCVLQLSNHLNFDLTDPQEWCTKRGRKLSGPLNDVIRNTREVFSFQGDEFGTYFILSFRMRKYLRISIACWTLKSGEVALRVGFTPEGVPTANLAIALFKLKKVPDAYEGDMAHDGMITCKNETLEYFVLHGKLLARAHMSPGKRSVVHLEILEVGVPRTIRIPTTPNNLAGLFQITNCLTVSLKNARRFDHKGEITVALPQEVLPGSREILFLSHTRIVEAIFSYEIDSTDLGFVLAFRVQGNRNAFSAAFVPLPTVTDKTNFDSAMDPEQWKSHLYRKHANAEDGKQVIQIRNIRAEVSMTAEEKPQFRIRIFAV